VTALADDFREAREALTVFGNELVKSLHLVQLGEWLDRKMRNRHIRKVSTVFWCAVLGCLTMFGIELGIDAWVWGLSSPTGPVQGVLTVIMPNLGLLLGGMLGFRWWDHD
jgi:hypothetical protein